MNGQPAEYQYDGGDTALRNIMIAEGLLRDPPPRQNWITYDMRTGQQLDNSALEHDLSMMRRDFDMMRPHYPMPPFTQEEWSKYHTDRRAYYYTSKMNKKHNELLEFNVTTEPCGICFESENINTRKCDVCTMHICSSCLAEYNQRTCPTCKKRFYEGSLVSYSFD